VLALGVLHGGRRSDALRVAAARAGDRHAIDQLRGVHRASGVAGEEFSLDGFTTVLALAARETGCSIEVVERYPFLVGDDPATLPGLDELAAIVESGALLVVTTDPIHHGHAYGSPPAECLAAEDPATVATARALIEAQLALLSAHRFDAFQVLATRHRSDFRDTGPVMAALLGAGFAWTLHDLALVDYSAALEAQPPSWVAGALVTAGR
jgi:hypothetical protein